jgi:hypothetical protein
MDYSRSDIVFPYFIHYDEWGPRSREYHPDWRIYTTQREALTVVGIYAMPERVLMAGYQPLMENTIFIPASVPPADWFADIDYIDMRHFSFALKHSGYEDAFRQEFAGALFDMGFFLDMPETGYQAFYGAASSMKTALLLETLIFGVLMIAVIYFTTLLFFKLRAREFAVMRALGVTKRFAVTAVTLPIALIYLIGLVLGGVSASVFAMRAAVNNLDTHMSVEDIADLPVYITILYMAVVFAVMVLCVLVELRKLTRRSELAILQAGGR